MQYEPTDEQRSLTEVLRGWLSKQASSERLRTWLDRNDPEPFEEALVRERWLSVGSNETIGGQGGGLFELALMAEELARAAAPSSAWLSSMIAVPLIAGEGELANTNVFNGEFLALAVSADEPPDVIGNSLIANGGRIDGVARAILGADRAKRFIVPIWTDERVALMSVDVASEGVLLSPRLLLDRTRSIADVNFVGARYEQLGEGSLPLLTSVASRAAVLTSADALGVMSRMLELAVDYSRVRQQFGAPIGSFQAVKHAAATMLVEVESARSMVYLAAASLDEENTEATVHAATAKAQVTAAAARVADMALTLHGAIGYTWEYDLHLFYKRAMLDRFLYGAPEIWNERIAASLPLIASPTKFGPLFDTVKPKTNDSDSEGDARWTLS